MMHYTNYTNMDSRFSRVYEPGDCLVKGWEGEIDLGPHPVDDTSTWLEGIFSRHNRDDRPDGQLCPSMSIGDVIVLGESAWSIDGYGFARVDVRVEDLITDRTWRETVS